MYHFKLLLYLTLIVCRYIYYSVFFHILYILAFVYNIFVSMLLVYLLYKHNSSTFTCIKLRVSIHYKTDLRYLYRKFVLNFQLF